MIHNLPPSIVLQRHIIMKSNKPVYDETFHNGVNIIYSDGNSTGKSTIIDSIFYILGGDVEEWIEEILECDYIISEILIRNKVVTFKREIEKGHSPIYIYEGTYEESLVDSVKWLKFAHKRSEQRESFSQAIFKLLGFPEHKLSNFSNITIHEILRLVYSDQLTSVNKIFKSQRFDSDEMKRTIGELILGIDNLDLHELRLNLRNEEKRYSTFTEKLNSTESVFKLANITPDINIINKEINEVKTKKDLLKDKLVKLETSNEIIGLENQNEKVSSIRKELLKIKKELQDSYDYKNNLEIELDDSKLFIESLNSKLSSLNQSEVTKKALGELRFEYCPSCLSLLSKYDSNNHSTCHLCKNNKSDEEEFSGFLRMQIELKYQIRESEEILNLRKKEIENLESRIYKLELDKNSIQEKYNLFINTANPITAEIKNLIIDIAKYEYKIQDISSKISLVKLIDDLKSEKENSLIKINNLSDKIDKLERDRDDKVYTVKKRIEELTLDLLKKDIPSEETFSNAKKFEFNFEKNKLTVDGKSKFSASSVCYLKTAFLFSLFLISLEQDFVLFPRFALHDNIEDKGATPERIQNMHRLIIDNLKKFTKHKHQLILTTSVLDKSLENSKYCVGPKYRYNLKTLNLS